jgi:hypothetical protein
MKVSYKNENLGQDSPGMAELKIPPKQILLRHVATRHNKNLQDLIVQEVNNPFIDTALVSTREDRNALLSQLQIYFHNIISFEDIKTKEFFGLKTSKFCKALEEKITKYKGTHIEIARLEGGWQEDNINCNVYLTGEKPNIHKMQESDMNFVLSQEKTYLNNEPFILSSTNKQILEDFKQNQEEVQNVLKPFTDVAEIEDHYNCIVGVRR